MLDYLVDALHLVQARADALQPYLSTCDSELVLVHYMVRVLAELLQMH